MAENDYKTSSSVIYPLPPSIASDSEFATGTSTTASPTVKQCKEKLVTIDTVQTITGRKVFTDELQRKSTDIDVTSKATSGTFNTLVRFKDKNGKELGAVNNAQMNGGNIRTVLEASNKDGYVPTIGVQAPYEGSTGGFGYAPNTPDNAPANAIVTKGYADAKLNAKANVDLSNLSAAGQAKFDAKADKDIPVIGIPATSGTVTLSDNTVYSGTMTGAMTFTLPAVTNATQYHQIKAMLYLPVVTINWGTTHYIGGEAPDVSGAGQYMIYWDYVPALSAWAVGAMKVG